MQESIATYDGRHKLTVSYSMVNNIERLILAVLLQDFHAWSMVILLVEFIDLLRVILMIIDFFERERLT